jgi:hypothetical protein
MHAAEAIPAARHMIMAKEINEARATIPRFIFD